MPGKLFNSKICKPYCEITTILCDYSGELKHPNFLIKIAIYKTFIT